MRPPCAGITRSSLPVKSRAPTRFPCRVSRRARTPTKSTSRPRFCREVVPKSTDGLRSRRNHAVSSRSSMDWRKNLGRRVVVTGGIWIRRSDMDPLTPTTSRTWGPLLAPAGEKAPDAIHPLPQGGEGRGIQR